LRHLELLVLLGALQASARFPFDMYLPAMPVMENVFHTSAQAVVRSPWWTFLIGFALGQSLYGPITDRFGRKPPLLRQGMGLFNLVLGRLRARSDHR
jgi:DHA1 family bicyclomycin/chloramphenicol resistance-like MFS transporter